MTVRAVIIAVPLVLLGHDGGRFVHIFLAVSFCVAVNLLVSIGCG